MIRTIVAEELNEDIQNIASFEKKYSEGDIGELKVYLQYPISDDTVTQLENGIKSKGVVLTDPIKTDSRVLIIHFKKAVEPLNIISSSLSNLGIQIVGWQLFKDTISKNVLGMPMWAWGIGGLLAVIILLSMTKDK